MRSYIDVLGEFEAVSENPKSELDKFLSCGKKVVGCLPYFCPEELIYASGMVPFGIWGADMEVSESKRWFPAFICSILQTALEQGIRGDLDGLSAVMVPKLCDSLKCMGANWELAAVNVPVINVAHAQNRKIDAGVEFTASQYRKVIDELEKLGGKRASNEDISYAIALFNKRRGCLREFTGVAAERPDIVTPKARNDVIKSSYFMDVGEFTSKLQELNEALRALPVSKWDGCRVVTTGIIIDAPELLKIFEDNSIAIATDQVLHESVSFRDDVCVDGNPVTALAKRMSVIEGTSVLYDPGKQRAKDLLDKVKEFSADGVIFVLTKFCDPEEYDYVPVRKLLAANDVPCLLIEVDRQDRGFQQARTAVEAFSELISR